MEPPKILTELTSLQSVFDSSGQLAFAIVFGLCRRSKEDTDSRSLVLDIAGSILDLPYALANGLLTIHERDPQDKRSSIDVDISRLKDVAKRESAYLSLSSPMNRDRNYRAHITVYQYHLRADSELASILEPGKRYTIKLGSDDIGVQSWAFQDPSQTTLSLTNPNEIPYESSRLVTSKSRAGSASFEVTDSLMWPPEIRTTMSCYLSKPSGDTAGSGEGPDKHSTTETSATTIEVSITNLGTEPISIQTRGYQKFLFPWVSFKPDVVANDNHMRILDPDASKAPNMNLQIINAANSQVIKNIYNTHNIVPSTVGKPDHRPRLTNLVILKPGIAVTRRIDVGPLVRGLGDGEYTIELYPKGCWWTTGEVAEGEADEGKVPQGMYKTKIPPLILRTEDKVGVRRRDGRVVLSG